MPSKLAYASVAKVGYFVLKLRKCAIEGAAAVARVLRSNKMHCSRGKLKRELLNRE